MADPTDSNSDIYHDYEQTVLHMFQDALILKDTIPQRSEPVLARDLPNLRPISRIAIVGAGVAGLSAAMKLNDPKAPYEIDVYESSSRVGGRLYTHHFADESNVDAKAGVGNYNYFDVGAMRFPDIRSMKPTFKLFELLEIETQKYHRTQPENWLSYNGIRHQRRTITPETWSEDPFHVSVKNGGGVPNEYAEKGPQHWYSKAIDPLVREYKELTMRQLIEKYDHYSIRGYMAHRMGYPTEVINWIETMNSGTSWFDRGLMQAILEGVAFFKDTDDPQDTIWKCVDGGSKVVSQKMVEYITRQENSRVTIKTQHHVTAIKFIGGKDLEVSGFSESAQAGSPSLFGQKYSHVILAIPPGCIRAIDLSTCELDFGQRNGLRELEVAPSSKIGIKFKTAWWRRQGITGGQSQTDRLARTIVYPSYGSDNDQSTVLIASYVWTQDSLILGALMKGPGSIEETRLKDLMLADLAHVHGLELSFLENEFESIYAFDWSTNSLSMGAFGIFGPGQWGRFYNSLSRPAARGQLYFVGEAFSSIHGWVAGALESSSHAVCELLNEHKWACEQSNQPITYPSPFETFKKKWGLEFPEDEETFLLQLVASIKLQKEEFGY